MNTCAATRLLIPAFFVGLIVSTLAGSDLAGWAAAAVTAGLLFMVGRARGTTTTCALPAPRDDVREPVDAGAGPNPS